MESLEAEIEENKKHFEELEEQLKQLEADASVVLEAHKKAQVSPNDSSAGMHYDLHHHDDDLHYDY